MKNKIIFGENIEGLEYLIDKCKLQSKIDLIYIDPPFATGNNFSIDDSGRVRSISSSSDGCIAYTDKLLGSEFIEFLRERLILLKKLLSNEGSIYLHTDYKIGHYVKVMMDEVFGIENFRGDICRVKCNPKNFKRVGYGNIKDCILFYSKGKNPIWNEPIIPYTAADLDRLYKKKDKQGRRYTTVPIHAPGETKNPEPFKGVMPPKGRHWRTSVDELNKLDEEGLIEWSKTGNPRRVIYPDNRGKRAQDIWEYKDPMNPIYPTEKNRDFIDLIIKTSSNEDSIVLDCFAGSGTTLESALVNRRKFIGIDKSSIAFNTIKERLGLTEGGLFKSEIELIELS